MTTFQTLALYAVQVAFILFCGGLALAAFFEMFEAKTRRDQSEAIVYFIGGTALTTWLVMDMVGW